MITQGLYSFLIDTKGITNVLVIRLKATTELGASIYR